MTAIRRGMLWLLLGVTLWAAIWLGYAEYDRRMADVPTARTETIHAEHGYHSAL